MSNFDLDIAVAIRNGSREYKLIATDIEAHAIIRVVIITLLWLLIDAVKITLDRLVGWVDALPKYYERWRKSVLYWITPEIGIRPVFV